ncbi:LysR family transcriptional regulator [Pseudomonas oryzihabitans]|uniref:LysR family transcriptional regulator n=1 Tax=Pseudomonas oryzihabitans TaxID=47885 RepID=UPI0025554B31|nr:LysR family transcriptional regulator [Pseudomonas oryzihabitans]MDK8265281.1 LysR family transcriptional regulator [Pseudomonas oryzihabitans]
MRYDLLDLRLFLHVVAARSITLGAERSHLALPSASGRIKALEDSLGTLLLIRHARGVRPTPAGVTLERHARAILSRLEEMDQDLAGAVADSRTRVRLLGNGAAVMEHLDDPLAAFLQAQPRVDVEVEELPSSRIVLALREGRADLGIFVAAPGLEDLQIRPFRDDPLVLVAAPGSLPLPDGEAVDFARLLEQPFVGLSRGNALQLHVEAQAAQWGRELAIRIRVPSPIQACALVARGLGLAILPAASLVRAGPGVALVSHPLRDAWARRELVVGCRDGNELSPAAAALLEVLVETGREGVDAG